MNEKTHTGRSTGKRKRLPGGEDDGDIGCASLPVPPEEANREDEEEDEEWSEETHRAFVDAIFDAGLSHSSPSVIYEQMSRRPAVLTNERIKSHLQKYRKNKTKSKEDFMQEYDSFLRRALSAGGIGSNTSSSAGGLGGHAVIAPATMLQMMGGGKASGGGIAALLTYLELAERKASKSTDSSAAAAVANFSSIHSVDKSAEELFERFGGTHLKLPFPVLSESERKSPLGISLFYSMGLISSMTEHIMQQRASLMTKSNYSNYSTGQAISVEDATIPQANFAPTQAEQQGSEEPSWGLSVKQDSLYVLDADSFLVSRDHLGAANAAQNAIVGISKSPIHQWQSTSSTNSLHQIPQLDGTANRYDKAVTATFDMNLRRNEPNDSTRMVNSTPNNDSKQKYSYWETAVHEHQHQHQQELQRQPSQGLQEFVHPQMQQQQQPIPYTGAQLAFTTPDLRGNAERRPSEYGFFQPIPEGINNIPGDISNDSPLDDDDSPATVQWFSVDSMK